MKRINDIRLLPDYLKNNRYEESNIKYSSRRLSLEIHERQSFYSHINDFENYYRKPEKYKGSSYYIGAQLALLHDQHIKVLPNGRSELTIEEYIEIDKSFYFQKLKKLSERLLVRNKDQESFSNLEKKINNKNKWDSRPYIRPITSKNPILQKSFDISFTEFRKQFTQIKNQAEFCLNLDFSDDEILEAIRPFLKFLRKRTGHKVKFKKPKDFIRKLKQQKILQVMDIYLWQMLNNRQIEYEVLARFLYPNGKFSGKQLRETIIPTVRKLLNSESPDSQFLYYIADKEFMKKVA